jgi:hypothetical protein
MPFVNVALGDAKEPEAAPEGEYDLRIVKSEDGESKAGNPMTTVYIKIEDSAVPNAALVRHWITYPDRQTPPDQVQMRLLDIARFLQCFGIPHEGAGFNTDDLLGATGRCFVGQEEADDGNVYNRLKLPKLKN